MSFIESNDIQIRFSCDTCLYISGIAGSLRRQFFPLFRANEYVKVCMSVSLEQIKREDGFEVLSLNNHCTICGFGHI